MVRAVIFDMDGVIADSHGIVNRIFSSIIRAELGIEISEDEFSKRSGLRFEQRVRLIAEERKLHIPMESIRAALDKARLEYHTNGISYVVAFPETIRLIGELRKKGIQMALGTNGSRRGALRLAELFGIKDFFSAIVTFDDVAHPKPAPDIFERCAELLGVAYSDCVVVEDSVEGIGAAKAAGMRVVAVTTTKKQEELSAADIVCSIKDLNAATILNLK